MKNLVSGFLALSLVLGPAATWSAQELSAEQISQKLKNEKDGLVELNKELRKAKASRNGWVAVRLAAGLTSVLTAIPGVVVIGAGVHNLAKGQQFMGDPDNGGAIMIPVVIATTVISAAAGAGAVAAHNHIQLRSQDIERLTAAVDAKLNEIQLTESLLQQLLKK